MADIPSKHPSPADEAGDPVAMLSALDAVAYDWDIASDKISWGPNVARTLRGLDAEALAAGAGYAALVTCDSESSRYDAVFNGDGEDDGEGVAFRVQYRLGAAGGGAVLIEDFGRWFADAEGRPARVHGLARVLRRHLDGAAGGQDGSEPNLASRRVFNAFVDQRCAELRVPDSALALMVVGLGNLAEINLREGYDVGDEVLAGVGRRLALSLRGGDKMVRYCGAKFALMVSLSANDKPAVAAERIARRASAGLLTTSAGPQRVVAHVGVALAPRHGRKAHLLVQRADEALSKTAENGERVLLFSSDEAAAESRRRDAWVGDEIVAALNARRIVLAFQPVVSVAAGWPSFEEALMRLRLEDGSMLGPDAVIPVAEKLGLIELIDERVFELAVACLAEAPHRRLSVNVSMASLRDPEWVDRLQDRLAAAAGVAGRLTVEIAEAQAMQRVAEAAPALARLKALGVRVAFDDFGAGHASFRSLRSLGVDMVKIDGAFVAGLASSADDRFYVRSLASLARTLGVLTVAERVEDVESARLLREWGVDFLQGHYIGRADADAPPREKARA